MTRNQKAMEGTRLMNRGTGEVCRITEVKPFGKTSVRFVLFYDNRTHRQDYEITAGELDRDYKVIDESVPDYNLQFAERIDALIGVIDGDLKRTLPYRYGHMTEIRSRFTDIHGRDFVDQACLSRELLGEHYRLAIYFYGGRYECVSVSREELGGGCLWPAFKPRLIALRDSMLSKEALK